MLEAHNIQLIALIGGALSRVATPLKDPNQQNKYRDPPNIYIIPNSGFKKYKQQYLCIVYFLHGEAGDENKSKAEKNKVVSIMAPHRMGEYSPEQATYSGAHKITLKTIILTIFP